jgi:hypothetical protein
MTGRMSGLEGTLDVRGLAVVEMGDAVQGITSMAT